MRRILAAAGALSLTVLGLTACAAGVPAAASCERDLPSAGALELVEVADTPVGDEPEITVTAPVHVDESAVLDLVPGEGRAITRGLQDVVIELTLVDGSTGTTVAASGYTGGLTQVSPVESWDETIPGLGDALQCAAEGSRVAVALSPDATAGALTRFGMAEDATAVVVVDVLKVYLPAADGAEQFNDRAGMPSVVHAPDGRPGIVIPDAAPPSDLAVQVLKRGDGAEVTGEQPVRVHYTGLTWADREVFETTWDTGAQPVTLDAMIPGFADALRGQTVGSQVLVVIPPDQGYGEAGQGAIAPNSTLVFVIDILGLDAAA